MLEKLIGPRIKNVETSFDYIDFIFGFQVIHYLCNYHVVQNGTWAFILNSIENPGLSLRIPFRNSLGEKITMTYLQIQKNQQPDNKIIDACLSRVGSSDDANPHLLIKKAEAHNRWFVEHPDKTIPVNAILRYRGEAFSYSMKFLLGKPQTHDGNIPTKINKLLGEMTGHHNSKNVVHVDSSCSPHEYQVVDIIPFSDESESFDSRLLA